MLNLLFIFVDATTITLEKAVTWPVGSQIILVSTDFSQVIDYRILAANTTMSWSRGQPFPDQTEVYPTFPATISLVD